MFVSPSKKEVNGNQRQRNGRSSMSFLGRDNKVKAWQRHQISKIFWRQASLQDVKGQNCAKTIPGELETTSKI